MRIFFASILNFVLFQCWLCINNKILVKIKTTRNEKNVQDRPKKILFLKFIPLSLRLSVIEFSLF
jgi:hypothetical protein